MANKQTDRSDLTPLPKYESGAHAPYIKALLNWVEDHQKTSQKHTDCLLGLNSELSLVQAAVSDLDREVNRRIDRSAERSMRLLSELESDFHRLERRQFILQVNIGFVAATALFLHFFV